MQGAVLLQLEAGMVVDRYTIESTLGSGGMATVYLARHQQLGSLHAIKVLRVLTPGIRARLLQEGRVQGGIRHPNVVAVTDLVEVDGTPALVLEYIHGPSLAQLLDKRMPSLAQADALARGILRGVSFAHRNGLIHRDLKPANILLAIRDGELAPKITDFGLAKILEGPTARHETRSGVGLGTPSYMAPEQIRDAAHVDQRADVFSLGAILFELVSGRICFQGNDNMETFRRICDGTYDNPRRAVPDLPERMVRAIEEALRVDPDARPADASELLSLWTGNVEGLDSTPLVSLGEDAWTEEILRSAEGLAPSSSGPSLTPAPQGEATFAVSMDFSSPPDSGLEVMEGPTAPSLEELADLTDTATRESLAPESALTQTLLAAVAAAAAGAPFLLGSLTLVFGSMAAAMDTPGVMLGLASSLLGLALVGACAFCPPRHMVTWLLAPTALSILGNVVGGGYARDVLARLAEEPVTTRAGFAASGVAEALSADLAAMTLASLLLLVTVDAAAMRAVMQRGSLGPLLTPRRIATVLTASLGGGALWLVASHFDDGPGPFALFAMLSGCGLACAAVAFPTADEDEEMSRLRLLTSFGTTVGVMSAAKLLYLQQVAWKFEQVQAAKGDQLVIAEQFATAIGDDLLGFVLLWTGLAFVVGLIPHLGVGAPCRLPWAREVGLLALGAATIMGSKVYGDGYVNELGGRVVPAFLDLEAERLLGMQLADSTDHDPRINSFDGPRKRLAGPDHNGVTVVLPGPSGLEAGDVLLSVGERTVSGVRPLLETLRSCACGQGGDCPLASCLNAGDRVAAIVRSGDRMQAVRIPVLYGQPFEPQATDTRVYPFPGLTLEAPVAWHPSAEEIPFLDGTLLQIVGHGEGVDLHIAAYRDVTTGIPTLDGWSAAQLEALGAGEADLSREDARSRTVLGVTSAAKAVSLTRPTGRELWEFHHVLAGERHVFLRIAMPEARREEVLPAWWHLLETMRHPE